MMSNQIDIRDLVPKGRPDETRVSTQRPVPGPGAQLIEEFQKVFGDKIRDLVDITQYSARMDRDFASGKVDNLHEVMIAGAKAGLAVETAVQVRNLALRAYQNLTQLR